MTFTVKANLNANWSILFTVLALNKSFHYQQDVKTNLDLRITNIPRYILDSGVNIPPDPDLDHSLIWVFLPLVYTKTLNVAHVKYGLMITMIISV